MPDRPLPESYLSFLSWSNGGEFRQGQRWMQFFPLFDERHGVRAIMLAYELPQCMPGALPFAANGGGTFYLFDMRQPSKEDEYNVVCSHAGNFGWGSDECLQIADSFAAACLGKSDVDELKWQAQR
ncbi:MAG: SMI1/KNR4 family protein [Pirellulales bacterium]